MQTIAEVASFFASIAAIVSAYIAIRQYWR